MEKITDTILKFLKLDTLVQNVTGYVEARIALMKVEVREDVSKAISRGLVIIAMFLIGFLFLVFFSIGLAQFFNSYFSYPYAGYWIVSGIYAATFLILFVFKNNLYAYFENQFSELMKRKEK